jgi:hypothetical protein
MALSNLCLVPKLELVSRVKLFAKPFGDEVVSTISAITAAGRVLICKSEAMSSFGCPPISPWVSCLNFGDETVQLSWDLDVREYEIGAWNSPRDGASAGLLALGTYSVWMVPDSPIQPR